MLLKTATLTLLGMVLLDQSTTSELSSLQDEAATLPGFSFTGGWFKKMHMNATKGTLRSYDAIWNTTEWRFSPGPNSKAISQAVELPVLNVLYENTKAQVGWLLRATGKVVADIGTSVFQLTLNATANTNAKNQTECRLQVQMFATELQVDLDLNDLGLVGFNFKSKLLVMRDLTATVRKNLETSAPPQLSIVLKQTLSGRMNMTTVCSELLASNSTNFPEPKIF